MEMLEQLREIRNSGDVQVHVIKLLMNVPNKEMLHALMSQCYEYANSQGKHNPKLGEMLNNPTTENILKLGASLVADCILYKDMAEFVMDAMIYSVESAGNLYKQHELN